MLRSDAAWWQRHLADVALPDWIAVRQAFADEREPDLAAAVRRELGRPEVQVELTRGARVAVGVGSRGLAGLAEITRATIEVLLEAGCEPFIVPAMGSHGGATADTQSALIAGYGVTEANMGAPLRSSMDAVEMGRLANGMPVYFDRAALEADLVVPINRIKSHTSFRGPVESGLAKMLVIGFGNHLGAQAIHARGYRSFADNLLEARALLLPQIPFRFGLASLENAHGAVARVEAVTAAALATREPGLLLEAKRLQPRLPADQIDLLVVGQIGKNVSGLGMDPAVTGRYSTGLSSEVEVERLVVLGLTPESRGNAVGLGLADITTAEVVAAVDLDATWINATTSTSLSAARLPIAMPSVREALKLGVKTCGQPDPTRLRAVWIDNSSRLDELRVSEGLWRELEGRAEFERLGTFELGFDEAGAPVGL